MSLARIQPIPAKSSNKNPTRQQLLAYRCRLLSQLADALAPARESTASRKAFHLIADELFEISGEIIRLEPEELPLKEVLRDLRNSRANRLPDQSTTNPFPA